MRSTISQGLPGEDEKLEKKNLSILSDGQMNGEKEWKLGLVRRRDPQNNVSPMLGGENTETKS